MIIEFLDYKSKKIVFSLECLVVPQKGDMIEFKHVDFNSQGFGETEFINYRVLNVCHSIKTYTKSHTICCLVTDNDSYFEYEYGK